MIDKYHPQHKFQFCPRCGSNEFTFNPDYYFICSACQFQYYINAGAAVAAIIRASDGRILLTRRAHEPKKGCLDLPGGFVDPMEEADHALRRELKEELNVEPEEMKFLFSVPNRYIYNDLLYFTLDLIFLCRLKSLQGLRAADEVIEYQFITPGEIPLDQVGFESTRNAIKRFLKNHNR